MKDEINIVKELPSHMKSLDIEAVGSQVYHRTFDILARENCTCPLLMSINSFDFDWNYKLRLSSSMQLWVWQIWFSFPKFDKLP